MRKWVAVFLGLCLTGCGIGWGGGSVPTPSPSEPAARLPFPDGTGLDLAGSDLLFGSAIGSWPMGDDDRRYDGHPMLNLDGSCPSCPALAQAARVSVVRWGIWNVFEDMTPPPFQTAPLLPRSQFDSIVDGIRGPLGAHVLIQLPPGESSPVWLFCPETWGYANLLALDKEVIRQADKRVQLYEVGNEPELACWRTDDVAAAGAGAAELWVRLAPDLRKHARALGIRAYLGGPAFTTTHVNPRDGAADDVKMARAYLRQIKKEYDDPRSARFQDPDLIPSFYSFHAYGTEYLANGGEHVLDAIPHYAAYVDGVRAAIDEIWGPVLGPRIRIACTEWNYGAEDFSDWGSPDVAVYYSRFLAMLRERRVWLANQFLMASNGNGMDMITRHGQPTAYYQAFKAASLGSN